MKTVLLFGAGKSATSLIEYLGKVSDEYGWNFIVCDTNLALAKSKIMHYRNSVARAINVSDETRRQEAIREADLVISMLPAALHFLVAKDCVHFSKNLLTASYIDDQIRSLEKEIREKGLLFIGEMGLDPGIDHMSAMKLIHEIKNKGGTINSFTSHCGGLVSPENDDNPWHYKITWNPANVVAAGSSGAVFLKNKKIVEIPYEDIFKDEENIVDIPELGPLSWYANRDSLSYINTYQLDGVHTFLRTTLRHPLFTKGWNIFVHAGFTSKTDGMSIRECTTLNDWFQLKMNGLIDSYPQDKWDNDFIEQIDFLGMRSNSLMPGNVKNSAVILLELLEKNLVMKSDDKDMIVMLHELEYEINGRKKGIKSSLIVKGKDHLHTAMSQTVGLPLGIVAKLILQNNLKLTGLHIPISEKIYSPVLSELAQHGIKFYEQEKDKFL